MVGVRYVFIKTNSSRIAQVNNLNFLLRSRGKGGRRAASTRVGWLSAPTQWTQSVKQWF